MQNKARRRGCKTLPTVQYCKGTQNVIVSYATTVSHLYRAPKGLICVAREENAALTIAKNDNLAAEH